jgi:hypothetical protein
MRRALAVLLAAAGVALSGCGGDSGEETARPESSASTTAVDPAEYADAVIDAFDATYPTTGTDVDAPAADWAAFASVIGDLTPPEGQELNHERMVTAFEAYVDAREQAEAVCDGVDWDDPEWAACTRAVRTSSDRWTGALDRAYELPGLSWQALLG